MLRGKHKWMLECKLIEMMCNVHKPFHFKQIFISYLCVTILVCIGHTFHLILFHLHWIQFPFNSFICLFICSFTSPFNSFIHLFINSFLHSFIQFFIHPFIHSFIHSLMFIFQSSYSQLLAASTLSKLIVKASSVLPVAEKINISKC